MNNKTVLSVQDVIDEIQDLDDGFALFENTDDIKQRFYRKQQTVLELASGLKQEDLIIVLEYFSETQSSYAAAPLLQLLSEESKKKLLDDSGWFDLNVALIGEYGVTHWIDALLVHFPEVINRRVEWALKAIEEDLLNYKEVIDTLPSNSVGPDVFTYRVKVQESVLWSFHDCLTFEQLDRYVKSVSSVERAAHSKLQELYEEEKVLHEKNAFEKNISEVCKQRSLSGQVIVSRKNYKI